MAKIRKTIVTPDATPDNAPISDGDLQETAEVYQKHVNLGLSGLQGLRDTFGYTRRTAGRRVALARKAGLLPETKASLNAQQRVLERGTAYAPKTADRKSTRLNSSHVRISYAVFCLKKKKTILYQQQTYNKHQPNQPT